MLDEDDTFASVSWDDPPQPQANSSQHHYQQEPIREYTQQDLATSEQQQEELHHQNTNSNRRHSTGNLNSDSPKNQQPNSSLTVHVKLPVRELEGTKDSFVSYLVTAQTDLSIFQSPNPSSRRRFQDFVFLHDHLIKDFPASVVPPLPDKSRLKYVTGDRFSPDFVERRRSGLERFMQRLARHPTLSRSKLLRSFIESSQWNVDMHTHLAHPPVPEAPATLLEMASDTLLNAFSKVRKPDERFLEIRDGLERFEERLVAIERIEGRSKTRITDLASDYEDLAASIQGLGFLESGITDPLSRFESALLDYSIGLRDLSEFQNTTTTTPLITKLVSLINYSDSFRNVLKLRDQKQLDFEDLSSYLSNLTTERDRIAAGFSTNLGLSSYLKEKLEFIRSGAETDTSREAKIHKLDGKIKDLQEAVTSAHETSDQFNQEVIKEFKVFQDSKALELKEILNDLADGNISMYKKSIQDWENMIPFFERIRVDT
ncbi:intercellular trafficking and secretion [Puccinia graminis f. sp. tritici]|nr:intercellular trafficking and secretion [Puccinia graminis f. sp. tritici]